MKKALIIQSTSGTFIEYPEWWADEIILKLREYMQSDDQSSRIYSYPSFQTLNITHWKAREISNMFFKTVDNNKYKILNIQSIENPKLWEQYSNEREILRKEIGSEKLNERALFHGTNFSVIKTLVVVGFMRDFSSTHEYGYGSYFARDARYSVVYCQRYCGDGVQRMLVCSVLCGESTVGKKKFTLKSWPTKNNSKIMFDSLVEKKLNPGIFVIHKDRRIYPMFVISFKGK